MKRLALSWIISIFQRPPPFKSPRRSHEFAAPSENVCKTEQLASLKFNKTGGKAAVGSTSNNIFIGDRKKWKLESILTSHEKRVCALDWKSTSQKAITDIRQRNGRDAMVLGKLSSEVCGKSLATLRKGHARFEFRGKGIPGKCNLKPPDVLQSIENTHYIEFYRRDDKVTGKSAFEDVDEDRMEIIKSGLSNPLETPPEKRLNYF